MFDTVDSALAAARAQGLHHFPVRHRERVIGMVCACELAQAEPTQMVGVVMHPVVSLPETRSAADIAMLMRAAAVGSVLLTDESGEMRAVATRTEITRDPQLAALFEDYRCGGCGKIHHLHRYGDERRCFSCRQKG